MACWINKLKMISTRFACRQRYAHTLSTVLHNKSVRCPLPFNYWATQICSFHTKIVWNSIKIEQKSKQDRFKPMNAKQWLANRLYFQSNRCLTNSQGSGYENYALFRKGQNIGYLSTLMQDPSDAQVVTEDNYHELHHYFDIPELAENIKENLVEVKISKRSKVPYNSPTGSWMQVTYPFAEKPALVDKYRKFSNNEVMVGKMLEEIDALWAETAFRYIRGCGCDMTGVSTVTAAVDHLEFDTDLLWDENLRINTYVIYTGSSTVYVKSDMYSKQVDSDQWNYKGHTIFIMAARQAGKSFKVPQMTFDGEDDPELGKTRQLLGNELKDYIVNLNNNLYKQAPNKQESVMIHEMFKKVKFNKDALVTVSDTVLKHNTLMHKQEKNSHGKVFGGFLMNRATEAAFLNARRFSEEDSPKVNLH